MELSIILLCAAMLLLTVEIILVWRFSAKDIKILQIEKNFTSNELMTIKHQIAELHDWALDMTEKMSAVENALDNSGIEEINKAFNDEFEKLMNYNVNAAYGRRSED